MKGAAGNDPSRCVEQQRYQVGSAATVHIDTLPLRSGLVNPSLHRSPDRRRIMTPIFSPTLMFMNLSIRVSTTALRSSVRAFK